MERNGEWQRLPKSVKSNLRLLDIVVDRPHLQRRCMLRLDFRSDPGLLVTEPPAQTGVLEFSISRSPKSTAFGFQRLAVNSIHSSSKCRDKRRYAQARHLEGERHGERLAPPAAVAFGGSSGLRRLIRRRPEAPARRRHTPGYDLPLI